MLNLYFIPVGGFVGSISEQISLTLRRTADAVHSRTAVSGHRRFNGRGRPASSAEYRTCGRNAATEKHSRQKAPAE